MELVPSITAVNLLINVYPTYDDDLDMFTKLPSQLGGRFGNAQISTLDRVLRAATCDTRSREATSLEIFSVRADHIGDPAAVKEQAALLAESGRQFLLFVLMDNDYDTEQYFDDLRLWTTRTDVAGSWAGIDHRLSLRDGVFDQWMTQRNLLVQG